MHLLLSINLRYSLRTAWSLSFLFVTLLFGAEAGWAESEQARSADDFVNSIGITVHLEHKKGVYTKYDALVVPRLQDLGIRHIRTAVWANDIENQRKILGLAELGIRSLVVMDPVRGITPAEAVKIANNLSQAIQAIEGPNEWDILRWRSRLRYRGNSFPEGLHDFQTELYAAMRSIPALRGIPIVAPSLINPNNSGLLGRVPCDFNNIHSYPRGKFPGNKSLERYYIPKSKLQCGNKPVIATETGYHNAINHQIRRKRSLDHPGLSEQVTAKYLPRLLLEYFNRGVERTYIYELIDRKPNPRKNRKLLNYGLIRNDGSLKPAYHSIRNMIKILNDSGRGDLTSVEEVSIEIGDEIKELPVASSGQAGVVTPPLPLNNFDTNYLDYMLVGNTNNIHHTLLQKRNGNFYLIIWQEVSGIKGKKVLSIPDRNLKLSLNTSIQRAKIYIPANSEHPIAQFTGLSTIDIKVPDHPIIIELVS